VATSSDERKTVALAEFASAGYSATSIHMIADLAGMSKSSVLSHFASKELLLEATVARDRPHGGDPVRARLRTDHPRATPRIPRRVLPGIHLVRRGQDALRHRPGGAACTQDTPGFQVSVNETRNALVTILWELLAPIATVPLTTQEKGNANTSLSSRSLPLPPFLAGYRRLAHAARGCSGGGIALGGQTQNSSAIPGTESQNALDRLSAVFPSVAGAAAQAAVEVPAGSKIADAKYGAAITQLNAKITKISGVDTVIGPFSQ
jgi:AcrR family transcriptional regulator